MGRVETHAREKLEAKPLGVGTENGKCGHSSGFSLRDYKEILRKF